MLKYWTYLTITFKQSLVYKADYFFTIVFNIVFFIIYYSIWTIIYKSQGLTNILDYTLANTITYYFVTTFLYRLDITDELFIGEFIWNGLFTNDIIRPINAKIVYLLDAFSQVLVKVVLFVPIGAIIFIFAHKYVQFPNTQYFVLFLISAILGMFLNTSFFLIINSLTFHVGDQAANIDLADYITKFLAGASFPLIFLPEKIYWLFNALPFKYIFYIPAEIFLGKLSTQQIYLSYLTTVLWTTLFYFIFSIIYRKGLFKYTGIGK